MWINLVFAIFFTLYFINMIQIIYVSLCQLPDWLQRERTYLIWFPALSQPYNWESAVFSCPSSILQGVLWKRLNTEMPQKKSGNPSKTVSLRRFCNFWRIKRKSLKTQFLRGFLFILRHFLKFLRGFRFSPDNYFWGISQHFWGIFQYFLGISAKFFEAFPHF